jgi:glucose/arabinose dehydrogenase
MSSRRTLLGETMRNQPKNTGCPLLYSSHGVGTLAFGMDSTLLASCGDGASYSSTDVGSAAETYYVAGLNDGIIRDAENVGAMRSQMITSLAGKILRLDPDTGDGVASNPFYQAAAPRSARSRVWTLGIRNGFRFSVRPLSGSHNPADGNPGVIYQGDVGWNTWEDMNVIRSGGLNLGWPLFEGLTAHSGYQGSNAQNKDAPNPLFGVGGCTIQFFRFADLLKQAWSARRASRIRATPRSRSRARILSSTRARCSSGGTVRHKRASRRTTRPATPSSRRSARRRPTARS